jgi:hypothetical protein
LSPSGSEFFATWCLQATRYLMLVNPASVLAAPFTTALLSAAGSIGIPIEVLRASSDPEIDAAFAGVLQAPGNAMVFGPDAFFYIRRAHIADLALRRRSRRSLTTGPMSPPAG